jgi:hypothetical protein
VLAQDNPGQSPEFGYSPLQQPQLTFRNAYLTLGTCAPFIPRNLSVTLFLVLKSRGGGVIVSNGSNNPNSYQLLFTDDGTGFGARFGNAQKVTGRIPVRNVFSVVAIVINTSTFSVYVNGQVDPDLNSKPVGAAYGGTYPTFIGAAFDGTNNSTRIWSGDIHELIAYDAALDATSRTNVELHLTQKWLNFSSTTGTTAVFTTGIEMNNVHFYSMYVKVQVQVQLVQVQVQLELLLLDLLKIIHSLLR